MTGRLQLIGLSEFRDRPDVELLEEAGHAVLRTHTLLDQTQACARREHVVDDARDLEGHECARDLHGLLPGLRFVEGANLGIVLHGAHARVTEREFEVAVALLGARAMPGPSRRVVGAGD